MLITLLQFCDAFCHTIFAVTQFNIANQIVWLTDLPRNATARKEIVFLLASDGELSVSKIASKLN